MRYQFQIDYRSAAPVRKNWRDAAWDAVNAGYASWREMNYSVNMGNEGGSIERLEDANSSA